MHYQQQNNIKGINQSGDRFEFNVQPFNHKKEMGPSEHVNPVRVVRTPTYTQFHRFKVGCSFQLISCSCKVT
jgi:hypothetical protein